MIDQSLQRMFKIVEPVGSRRTCVPAPTNTDDDYLCLVDAWEDIDMALAKAGFDAESRASYEGPEGSHDATFRSWRRGDTNLIVTCDPIFFNRFMLATNVAKMINLMRKDDRITLFQAILYGTLWQSQKNMIEFDDDHS